MSKKTIAIDIDDVLADNAGGFVAFSNERWGTNLTLEDYEDRWDVMWQIDIAEAEKRAVEFHASGAIAKYRHIESAKPVLERLSGDYRLIIITARRKQIIQESLDWIGRYYKGLFDDVHFAGMWDNNNPEAHKITKGALSRELGADYLIDDQAKHCVSAAEAGLKALLFGNYKWNKDARLPPGVTRVKDWAAVQEYFDAES